MTNIRCLHLYDSVDGDMAASGIASSPPQNILKTGNLQPIAQVADMVPELWVIHGPHCCRYALESMIN